MKIYCCANEYFEKGDFDEAEARYNHILDLDFNCEEARYMLSELTCKVKVTVTDESNSFILSMAGITFCVNGKPVLFFNDKTSGEIEIRRGTYKFSTVDGNRFESDKADTVTEKTVSLLDRGCCYEVDICAKFASHQMDIRTVKRED